MSTDPFPELSRRVRAFIRDALASPPTTAEAEAAFNRLALDLFAAQFTAVEPYRRYAIRVGCTPETISRWRDILPIPTTAFKEYEFTSLCLAERTIVFHSSGTTAHFASRHFHSPESVAIYRESLLPWFERHLLPREPGEDRPRLAVLTPPPEAVPNSSLAFMLAEILGSHPPDRDAWFGEAGSDGAWRLRLDDLYEWLAERVATDSRACLLGTAFSYVQLLDAMEAAGRSFMLPPGSRIMETGGYKGRSRAVPRDELRRLLAARLGVPGTHVISEYGMCELSSQAYDGVLGRSRSCGLHFPPWARVMVVSPETGAEVEDGGTGLLRVYDLANVRSVLAIQTEDLAVRRGGRFELIGRAPLAEARGCSLTGA